MKFQGDFTEDLERAGCKSGTLSGRYLNNGYVLGLIQHPGRLSGRHRGQALSHIWIAAHPLVSGRL